MNGEDNPEVRQLKQIKRELMAIESNTSAKTSFWHGVLYGIGWIIGSLIALLLLGWILSVIGVIPGFDRIAQDLNNASMHLGR